MRKLRALLRTGTLAAIFGLSLAGCPSNVGDQLTDLAAGLLDLSQDEVASLLTDFASGGDLPDIEVVPIDEVPVFDPALLSDIEGSFDDVDISEDEFDAQFAEDGQRPDDRPDVVLARGRLAGRFMNDDPGSTSDTSAGVFEGRWFAAGGAVRGFVRGRYEPLPREQLPPNFVGGGVFEGHYVNEGGDFRGYLRGTYGHARNGIGRFAGHWHDQHMQVVGAIGGAWEEQANRNGGVFGGHWVAFDICDEADSMDDGDLPGDLPSQQREPTEADDDAAFDLIEDELELLDAGSLEDFFADVSDDIDEGGADEEIDVLEDTSLCVDGAGLLRGWHRRGFPDGFDPNHLPNADGVWRARWRSASGERRGYVNGLWTLRPGQGGPGDMDPNDSDPNDDGGFDGDHDRHPGVKGYLVGRVFNDDDQQVGTIRGRFGIGHRGVGVFAGRYFNNDEELAGALRGRWAKSRGRRGGPLFGAWIHLDDEAGLDGDDGGDGDPNDPSSGG